MGKMPKIIFGVLILFILLVLGTVVTAEFEKSPTNFSKSSILMLDSSTYNLNYIDTLAQEQKNEDFYDTIYTHRQKGKASWYGPGFQGNKTANGERYDMYEENLYTAAHKTFPFNTILKVTRISTGKFIFVRINDRGPYVRGRIIDLNKSAKIELMENSGTTDVIIEKIEIRKNDVPLTFEEMCDYLSK